jgi:hypothetical protein
MSSRHKVTSSVAWALAIALLTVSHVAQADETRLHSKLIPANSIVEGKSIGEWTAEWWQWGLSFVNGQNPWRDDPTGELAYLGDVGGPVFFIGAIDDVNRSFSVPCGKYLLIPMLTPVWWLDPAFGDTEEFARDQNNMFVDTITNLVARMDGKRIPNLFSHREITPRLFSVTIPNGGLYGEVGGVFDAVSDGYWLMFKPLSYGKHTISFGATALDGEIDYRAKVELKVTGRCRDDKRD